MRHLGMGTQALLVCKGLQEQVAFKGLLDPLVRLVQQV
jgi:hypothetical protein